MKRTFLSLLVFILLPVLGAAQEAEPAEQAAPKVREDAFLIQKEIDVWRTDKAANSRVSVFACQAIQIHPNWFLTAAHCVYAACHGTRPCTVQITLAEADLRQQVRVHSSTANKRVFIYDGFFPGQNRISSVDVALIKLEPESAEYLYEVFDGESGSWRKISAEEFTKRLAQSPETKAQLNAADVRLVGSVSLPNAHFLPTVVVPRMTNGSLSYLVSPSKEVFFVKDLQHYVAPDFGVRQGNSGGGVFTAQGDLVGLVSSLVYSRDGSANFQNDEGKVVASLQNASDYFLFTGFNGSTLNFIRTLVPSLRVIGAENGFVTPVNKDFAAIVESINSTSVALE